jgi:hypothetical protein
MTKNFFETLLFASVAINAALLIFFAGVFRKMMNAGDTATFRNLIVLMVRYSKKSPFMIFALNIPLFLAIPYYYRYGFGNWWITTGLALWLVAGSLSKAYKMPVYRALANLQDAEVEETKKVRDKFNSGNIFQAALYVVATVLVAFGIRG